MFFIFISSVNDLLKSNWAILFSLYTFRAFFNLPFCIWSATVLCNSMDINWRNSNAFESQVKFLFWWFISKKSSSDANLLWTLCLDNFVMFSFSGGLVDFSYLVTHCVVFHQVIHHWILFLLVFWPSQD